MHCYARPARGFTLSLVAAAAMASAQAEQAAAQRGYVAAIAYSQSTGRIGHTARQARSEHQAKQLALRNCGAADARVFTWAQDQWVAIAVVDGVVGTAGFARGLSPEEAQAKALAECGKLAKGRAYRVALCIHSSGMRPQQLRAVAATAPVKSKTGYFAAIAFSPSTGKIGYSAGEGKTKEAAQAIALKKCPAADAKVFMWGDAWIAAAVVEGRTGTAGFGPGATKALAEAAALAQCRKQGHGAPCKIALCIYSAGRQQTTAAKPVSPPRKTAKPAPDVSSDPVVERSP